MQIDKRQKMARKRRLKYKLTLDHSAQMNVIIWLLGFCGLFWVSLDPILLLQVRLTVQAVPTNKIKTPRENRRTLLKSCLVGAGLGRRGNSGCCRKSRSRTEIYYPSLFLHRFQTGLRHAPRHVPDWQFATPFQYRELFLGTARKQISLGKQDTRRYVEQWYDIPQVPIPR